MSAELVQRILVLTTPDSSAGRMALLERLVATQGVCICGVISDTGTFAPWKRARFLFNKWGALEFSRSVALAVALKAISLPTKLLEKWHDLFIPPRRDESLQAFCAQRNIPLIEVENANSEKAISSAQSLKADLGIIWGGRILRAPILSSPRLGTLNIHKHDARKYRGGGQIGLLERLNGESHLGVTIHVATPAVDAGAIVAYREIEIEKFDTDQSLAIKADVVGVEAYYAGILGVLRGEASFQAQDLSKGQTYVTSPYWQRFWYWRRVRSAFTAALRRADESYWRILAQKIYARARLAIFYLALPLLARKMTKLAKSGKAPITIFYYHGVGNGADNWMTLPLELMWRHVSYARRYYEIISLSEAVRRLRSGVNESPALVFTFDDGYESCYKNLLPLCSTFKIPATLFVCAESAKRGLRLEHDLSKGYRDAVLMNVPQLQGAASAGLEIGSHTLCHEIMANLAPKKADYVLQHSKELLEAMLKCPIRFFSFPKGTPRAINQHSLSSAARMYDAIFSAYGGYNFPGQTNGQYFQRIANPMDDFTIKPILAGLHRMAPFYTRHASCIERAQEQSVGNVHPASTKQAAS